MIQRILLLGVLLLMSAATGNARLTLDSCVTLALNNYPLIQKYDLLARSEAISLSDINKGWLPQIGVYAQGSVQNAVPEFPDALSSMMSQMGTDIAGLGKLQYKAGINLNQTVWDGGTSKSQRQIARADKAERQAALDVQLYAVRERVENLYFGILLLDEQIKQSQTTLSLLNNNLERLKAMKQAGTAMQSDVDMIEAQYLSTSQQLIQAQTASKSYRRMLGIFVGIDIGDMPLEKPLPAIPNDFNSNRPELSLFQARADGNQARLESIRAGLMPRVGLFAQAFYGYPGFDNFASMMRRDPSFNVIASVKLSWNIGSLYTRDNKKQNLDLATEGINADRELFLFNTRLQSQGQTDRIAELDSLMRQDERIIQLRVRVREAAESQLKNGVIDATTLLTKITDENQARILASYHEIQRLQTIYQLKYTLNR